MSTVPARSPLPLRPSTAYLPAKIAASTLILVVAVGFIGKYVFRYYLNYNEAAFTDAIRGAANYWKMRGWLLMHMSGGMIAALTGPFQFWTGFRAKYANIHRWTGRLFLFGVSVGCVGAFRLAVATTFGWANAVWLSALAFAWCTTTGMAFYAISKGEVAVHKEWMVRAYVVTFAFVTFRLLNDYPPLSRLEPANDRVNTIGWACWAIPLLITELIMQARRIRKPV